MMSQRAATEFWFVRNWVCLHLGRLKQELLISEARAVELLPDWRFGLSQALWEGWLCKKCSLSCGAQGEEAAACVWLWNHWGKAMKDSLMGESCFYNCWIQDLFLTEPRGIDRNIIDCPYPYSERFCALFRRPRIIQLAIIQSETEEA